MIWDVVGLDEIVELIEGRGAHLIRHRFRPPHSWRSVSLAEVRTSVLSNLRDEAKFLQAKAALNGYRHGPGVEHARWCREEAKRIQSIQARELALLDAVTQPFINQEWSANAHLIDHLVRWLRIKSVTCIQCKWVFVPMRRLSGGRPRRFCCNSCKQAHWRANKEAGMAQEVDPHDHAVDRR